MIRLYNNGDETGINELFEAVFHKQRSVEQWQWKFQTLSSHSPIIIVAEEDQRIVGHAACLLFDGVDVNGSPILIGERVDIMVHPDYQGRGIYKQIVKELITESERLNVTYLYGFPAEQAKNIFMDIAQATDLGNINRYVSLILPSLLQKRSPHRLMKTLSDTELMKLEQSIECNQIHVKRSKSFLSNRFVLHPFVDYYVYQSDTDYVIYRIDRLKSVIPVYTILDLCARDEKMLLQSFKKTLGAGLVSTWGIPNTSFEKALIQSKFKIHSSPMPFVVKTLTNHEHGQVFNNWRILQGDVDSF